MCGLKKKKRTVSGPLVVDNARRPSYFNGYNFGGKPFECFWPEWNLLLLIISVFRHFPQWRHPRVHLMPVVVHDRGWLRHAAPCSGIRTSKKKCRLLGRSRRTLWVMKFLVHPSPGEQTLYICDDREWGGNRPVWDLQHPRGWDHRSSDWTEHPQKSYNPFRSM